MWFGFGFRFYVVGFSCFLKRGQRLCCGRKMVRPMKSTQEPRDDTPRDDSIAQAIRQMTEFMQQNFRPQQGGPWPQQERAWPQQGGLWPQQ